MPEEGAEAATSQTKGNRLLKRLEEQHKPHSRLQEKQRGKESNILPKLQEPAQLRQALGGEPIQGVSLVTNPMAQNGQEQRIGNVETHFDLKDQIVAVVNQPSENGPRTVRLYRVDPYSEDPEDNTPRAVTGFVDSIRRKIANTQNTKPGNQQEEQRISLTLENQRALLDQAQRAYYLTELTADEVQAMSQEGTTKVVNGSELMLDEQPRMATLNQDFITKANVQINT